MLVYQALQIVSATNPESKDWEMKDEKTGQMRKGISTSSDVTCIGKDGKVAVVKFKGKDLDEVKAKIVKLTLGKAADIVIVKAEPGRGGVLYMTAA